MTVRHWILAWLLLASLGACASSRLTAPLGAPAAPAEGLVWRARSTGTYFVRVTIGTIDVATGSGNYLLSISRNGFVGASGGLTISGNVDFGILDCNPANVEGLKPVPGVTLTAVGAATRLSTSSATGDYTLSNLVKDADYTVIPTKTGDVNGISTTDATRILQELTAPGTINACQASAGDAIFGNGSYQDGSTRRFSGDATPSRENGGFFSLGRMIAITDNTSLQRPALRQNRLHHRFRRWKKGKADIQGTAPHDDPV